MTDEEVDEAVLDAVVRAAHAQQGIASGADWMAFDPPTFTRIVWRAAFKAGEEAARAAYRTGLEAIVKTNETLQ